MVKLILLQILKYLGVGFGKNLTLFVFFRIKCKPYKTYRYLHSSMPVKLSPSVIMCQCNYVSALMLASDVLCLKKYY